MQVHGTTNETWHKRLRKPGTFRLSLTYKEQVLRQKVRVSFNKRASNVIFILMHTIIKLP